MAASETLVVELTIFDGRYRADLSRGIDAGHPIRFAREEATAPLAAVRLGAFSLPEPRREPVTLGSFVGSVERGGSVNCERLVLFPHGNGTHTECVGHVLQQPRSVLEMLPAGLVPALVVVVSPRPLAESGERYGGSHDGSDLVLTRAALSEALAASDVADSELAGAALVVRAGLRAGDHSGKNPPYFTSDAMALVDERGFGHLLTDLPSLDREHDGGALCCHRLFWGLAPGATSVPADDDGEPSASAAARSRRTVTELCRLDDVSAGLYLLSLQVAPLESDAAPSRPVLHPLLRVREG